MLGPLFLFFYTLLYRVFFELIIVLFRIFENSRDQVSLLRAAHPEASARVPVSDSFLDSLPPVTTWPPPDQPPAAGPPPPSA